jgi:AcrR family transcriptional regulator
MKKRSYEKKARAEAEHTTIEAVCAAALEAFAVEPFDRVTLQNIAEKSGVSVQTVIRHFGSKEKLFQSLAERETPRIMASREAAHGDSLEAAVEALVEHYEQDGDMILNFLRQEELFEPIREVVTGGRQMHREWVERHCADVLGTAVGPRPNPRPGPDDGGRERRLNAAIAATDLNTWKLLRRELGLEKREVAAVMIELLHGLKRRD